MKENASMLLKSPQSAQWGKQVGWFRCQKLVSSLLEVLMILFQHNILMGGAHLITPKDMPALTDDFCSLNLHFCICRIFTMK